MIGQKVHCLLIRNQWCRMFDEERSGSEKRRIVLERLKQGPLTTFDAERLVHRGQAVIGELRDRGHKIDTIKVAGINSYVWLFSPESELTKVTRTIQDAYYATTHWRSMARKRKEFDGYRCTQCKQTHDLHTHHWRYRLFEENLEKDLCTLCEYCHEEVHAAASGSSIHFPRVLPEEMIERILGGGS